MSFQLKISLLPRELCLLTLNGEMSPSQLRVLSVACDDMVLRERPGSSREEKWGSFYTVWYLALQGSQLLQLTHTVAALTHSSNSPGVISAFELCFVFIFKFEIIL